jgi:hypothetical protein
VRTQEDCSQANRVSSGSYRKRSLTAFACLRLPSPFDSQYSFLLFPNKFFHSFISGSTALCWPWPLLQFRNLSYTDSWTPRMSDLPVARSLPTHRATQTQNKHTQASMPRVGFEITISAFELTKTGPNK